MDLGLPTHDLTERMPGFPGGPNVVTRGLKSGRGQLRSGERRVGGRARSPSLAS